MRMRRGEKEKEKHNFCSRRRSQSIDPIVMDLLLLSKRRNMLEESTKEDSIIREGND
jgi:hypothetical protein